MPNADFFASNTIATAFAIFSTDQITVTRATPSGGQSFAQKQTYQGAADLQDGNGSSYFNPGGIVDQSDARLLISFVQPFVWDESEMDGPDPLDAIPDIQIGDVVTRDADGRTFTVVARALRLSFLPHLELQLKRGPISFNQKL